jgi:tRNA1(Val) A37 N6-methylase TrmN6
MISVVISTDYIVSITSGFALVGLFCTGKENDAEIVS